MEEKKVDRRVRKTKKQLRQALTKLMETKPVKDITVREIADIVDINRGTFYLHYKDVYDMLEQIENEMFEEFNEIINSQTGPLIVKPFPVLNSIFHYFSNNADMVAALMGPNGDQAFVAKLKNLVREKCIHDMMLVYSKGKTNTFDYYYEFVVYGCLGLFQKWLESGMRETPEEMAQLIEQIVMKGIRVLEV